MSTTRGGEVLAPLEGAVLPAGVRARFVEGVNGLRMHVLEAGFEGEGRPCVLLLHGFPEIAYSWRTLLPVLGAAGFMRWRRICGGMGGVLRGRWGMMRIWRRII